MTTQSSQQRIVYVFGPPNHKFLPPNEDIKIKVGLAHTEENYDNREATHKTHTGDDECLGKHYTHFGDAVVQDFIANNYSHLCQRVVLSGHGREIFRLKAGKCQELLDIITRFINGNGKLGKLKTHLARQEQNDCVNAYSNWKNNPINSGRYFLIDAIMRFGKTETAYRIIMKHDIKNTLILTRRPTDTKDAWIDGWDHVDFDDANIIVSSDPKYKTQPIVLDPNKRNIVFCSIHDMQDFNKIKFQYLAGYQFGLLVLDEFHYGANTENAKAIINGLHWDSCICLSGTPYKALLGGKFLPEDRFSWSYPDEQRARKQEIISLGEEIAKQIGQYYWLSPLKVFTIKLNESIYKDAHLFTTDEGFTFAKLFEVEGDKWKHHSAVLNFLETLSNGGMPYSTQSHLGYNYDLTNMEHTFWRLPGVSACELMRKTLENHRVFKKYKIIPAYYKNENEGKDTAKLVRRGIDSVVGDLELLGVNGFKKTGTITLSCGKLTHGVSIPEWGAVFVLSDMVSSQEYFQTIFRCKTERRGIKHECYVFDFNPNRTLQHMTDLSLHQVIANKSDDIKPMLKETLQVFNVLAYEDNQFMPLDIENVIAQITNSFTSGKISNAFANLPMNMNDEELSKELDDIILDGKNKPKIPISKNDIPNGKNSNNSSDDSPAKDDKSKEKKEEERLLLWKNAMKCLPLLFWNYDGNSLDELINNVEPDVCKNTIGISLTALKRGLDKMSIETKQDYSGTISMIRLMEEQEANEMKQFISS